MFRKIISNRDPRDTLYSELRKEFSRYFTRAGMDGRALLEKYPRPVFMTMVLLLFISAGLAFTVFRHREPVKKATNNRSSVSLTGGFNQVLQMGSAIREMIALKTQVDSLLTKKSLTRPDSAALEKDLDRLQQINNALKIKKH